jgi:hypothetical protein
MRLAMPDLGGVPMGHSPLGARRVDGRLARQERALAEALACRKPKKKPPHGEQSRRKLRVDARAFASVGWPAHARTVLPLADKNLLLALTDKPNTVQLDVPFDDDPETSRELHAQA